MQIPAPEDHSLIAARPSGVQAVHYGYRHGELAYIVFQRNSNGHVSNVGRVEPPRYFITLYVRDDQDLVLPGDCLIYDVVDGVATPWPDRIGDAEWSAFLASNPHDYSAAALLTFVGQHRTNAATTDPSPASTQR